MSLNSKGFLWKDVYLSWKYFIEDYTYKSIEDPIFKQVQIESHSNPNLNIGTEIIDWWPTNEIKYRTKS